MINKNLLIFIIIALVILGAVYYLSPSVQEMDTVPPPVSNDTSDSAIEKDLEDTELENLDEEFVEIEAELEAAISEAE